MRDKLKVGLLLLLVCALLAPLALAQYAEGRCPDNVHILVNAVQSYVQDHDEHMPPLDNELVIETALLPYVKYRNVFLCPITHEFYKFNRALSGVTMASIYNPSATELLRDVHPHPNGKSTIAYLDGYVTYGGVDLTAEKDCVTFARRLALCATLYAQDYDEIMPQMQNAAVFDQLLQPYTHDGRFIYCPVTQLPYTPNAALSGISLGSITDTGTTEVLRDAQPHPDGKVTIAYMDGIVTQGGVDPMGNTDCVTFVQRLMDGILGYTQDHDQVFPTLQNNAAFQSLLLPYTHDSRIFACPATNLPYALNSALSGADLTAIPDYGTVILVQDAHPHANGKSTVGYLDGHILQGGVVQPNTETACDDSLSELARAAIFYAQDNDEVLPPMNTFQQFMNAVYPYVKSSWKFRCPATNLNYVVNSNLSGVSLSTISDPTTTVMIQDAKAHPNHTKGYAYLDGHVERH